MKKKIRNTIFLISFFALAIIAYSLVSSNNAKQYLEEERKKVENIILELERENGDNLLIQKKQIENQFVNLVYETETGRHISYFVNATNGNLLELEDIIKQEQINNFKEKVKELTTLKYPKFISDVLNSGTCTLAYEIRDTDLLIYFSDFQINPIPKENLTLQIDYNEIKDFVNFPVHLNEEYENENRYHYDSSKKTIALTFDDGPNGQKTKKLVELLNQNKMHATFFMVGNRMSSEKNTVLEVLKNGNEIGSHSYNHQNLTRLKKEELLEEENLTNQIYKDITGNDLKLLRPPYGNINSLMKENLNYVFINWNIDTEDWRYRNVDHIFNEVITKVKDGDIILMHDLYDTTIEAVEKLLPELYVNGYQVVTITELANLKGKNLEYGQVYRSIK